MMEKVFVSSIVDATADTVWQTVRDFNGLPGWHPAIRDSEIEDGRASDAVGCVRSFHLEDGSHLRERLVGLSDPDRAMTYVILKSPMPVSDYVATLRVLPVTDGDRSYVEWTAEFEVPEAEAADTVELVGNGVFQAGFDRLKALLGRS